MRELSPTAQAPTGEGETFEPGGWAPGGGEEGRAKTPGELPRTEGAALKEMMQPCLIHLHIIISLVARCPILWGYH